MKVKIANPDRAHWMRELRKSNASGKHVPRPKKGTRSARKRGAIKASLRDS